MIPFQTRWYIEMNRNLDYDAQQALYSKITSHGFHRTVTEKLLLWNKNLKMAF